MKKIRATVVNEVGLHARPAALFVQSAGLYECQIMVRNMTSGGDFVTAKSILKVLGLGVQQGHEIEISVSGEDEFEAAETLKTLVESDFQALPDNLPPKND